MYGSNSSAKCSIVDDLDDCVRYNEDHKQQLLAIRCRVVFTQALQLTAGPCHTLTLHTPHMQAETYSRQQLCHNSVICALLTTIYGSTP